MRILKNDHGFRLGDAVYSNAFGKGTVAAVGVQNVRVQFMRVAYKLMRASCLSGMGKV
jgi:hypothetical protein